MQGNTWEELIARGREKLWNEAVRVIGQSDIAFLEFGVWEGYSIKFFSKLIKSEGSRFYGFDSFEGLPEEWRGMRGGHFSTHGEVPKIDDVRVKLVKGWFQDSLPGVIDAIAEASREKAVLVRGCPEFCVNGFSFNAVASGPQTGW